MACRCASPRTLVRYATLGQSILTRTPQICQEAIATVTNRLHCDAFSGTFISQGMDVRRIHECLFIFARTVTAGIVAGCGGEVDGNKVAQPVSVDQPGLLVLDSDEHSGEDLKPDAENWGGEVFAEQAGAQLKELARLLSDNAPVSLASLSGLAAAEVQGNTSHADDQVVFDDGTLTIRMFSAEPGVPAQWRGLQQFAAALEEMKRSFGEYQTLDVTLKIVGLEPADGIGNWTSTVRFESRISRTASIAQQRANYSCNWRSSPDSGSPKLTQISLVSIETAESSSPEPWFKDRTAAVLGSNTALHEQLSFGLDYWLRRIGRVHGMTYFKRQGIAIGDSNGDGLDDVYLCQGGGLPNKLFVQQVDGSAVDQSQAAGVDYLDQTASALFVDLDNDGDQDLALATFEGVVVLGNDGGGKVSQQAHVRLADSDLHALSAVDFDNDGDLDLYVTVDFADNPSARFLYHDANDGGRNILLRNDGGWKFVDATVDAGLDINNQRHSLATSWEDADNDGDQDLYVANDYGQNCFYVNDGGVFTEVAGDRGVLDFGSGMSVTWGDADRDGDMDLYVGNMFSSAGSRIVSEPKFLPNATSRGLYRRFVRGNSLYVNNGNASFDEVPDAGGASRGRWSWSSLFVDLNNDGWEDLFAANGYITTEDPGDL